MTQAAELRILCMRKDVAYWSYIERHKRGNVRGTKETSKLSPFPERGKRIKKEMSDSTWT